MSTNAQLSRSIQSCVLPHHQSVTVALSGGVDSVVMLHACLTLREQANSPLQAVNAIHIHHGLSPNADAWLAFCQQLCEQWQVAFQYKKVSVQAKARKSLEALARSARYAAIDELVEANSLVLLAQHEDDQAETVLLQLKRGAGPKGLSGMAQQYLSPSQIAYARPWINAGVGKQEVLAYAKQYDLTWVEDESNNDTAFERNFLRNDVMPILKKKWPQISKTINRSALLCASQNRLVEHLALEALQKNEGADGGLSTLGLQSLPDALAAEVLRLWSASHIGSNMSAAQLREVKKLSSAKADQVGCIRVAKWHCRSFNQYLYWVLAEDVINEPLAAIDLNTHLAASIEADLHSSTQTGTHTDTHTGAPMGKMQITFGDLHRKVKLFANRPSKTLKTWMKERQIKPWQRLAVPVICLNEQIVAVQFSTDLVISEQYRHLSVEDVAELRSTVSSKLLATLTSTALPNNSEAS